MTEHTLSLHEAALNLRDRRAVATVQAALGRCRARRSLRPADFDDLAQTVLIKLFKKRERGTLEFKSDEDRAVHAYLCSMLRNAQFDALRRAGTVPIVDQETALEHAAVEADEGQEHYLAQLAEQFRRLDAVVTASGTNAQRDVLEQIVALDAGEKSSINEFLPDGLDPAELKKRRDQLLTQHKRWRQQMLVQIEAHGARGDFDEELASKLKGMVLRLRQRGVRSDC